MAAVRVRVPTAAASLVLALCALAACFHGASAHDGHNHTTFNVGDSVGWVVPQNGYNYSAWAANHTFEDGDTLFFKYNASRHAVFRVSQADYTNCTFNTCNATNCAAGKPLFSDNYVGNSNYTLNGTGDYYFICPVGQHCPLGMKFKVTVKADNGAATAMAAAAGLTTAAAVALALALGVLGL